MFDCDTPKHILRVSSVALGSINGSLLADVVLRIENIVTPSIVF